MGSGAGITLFRDGGVFDGDRVHPRWSLLVAGGLIAAVGEDLEVPPGAQVLDPTGMTVLPRLIDAHMHGFAGSLRQALLSAPLAICSVGVRAGGAHRWKAP